MDGGHAYKTIGLGSCGSVFEIPGTELVVKKSSNTEALWNDFTLTDTVYNAFQDSRDLLQDAFPDNTIPRASRCNSFYPPNQKLYWKKNINKFPASHREVGAAFEADRILPLPQTLRDAVIDSYFDSEIVEEAKKNEENKSCLIRIYLGENETGKEVYDSLRNFEMRLSMIDDIGLQKF